MSQTDQPIPAGDDPAPQSSAGFPSPDDQDADDTDDHLLCSYDAQAPAALATDLFIHGVLSVLHRRTTLGQEARIRRVMRAVSPRSPAVSRWRFVRSRLALGAAAMMVVGTVVFFVLFNSEPSALAEVQRSFRLLSAPGDRRYHARVLAWSDPLDAENVPFATIDMRSDLLLVQHRPPGSPGLITAGRDAAGAWAIRPDGLIERDRPFAFWPPWSLDGNSLFIAALDRLPEQLSNGYALNRSTNASLTNRPGMTFDLISATRLVKTGPMPHLLQVWIDSESGNLERIEAGWTTPLGPDAAIAHATPPPPFNPDTRDPHAHPGGNRPWVSPKMIVVQRQESGPFPDGWFSPASHKPN